jgi:predicted ArsR family transcriptional regulator
MLNLLIKKVWEKGGDALLSQLMSGVVKELADNTAREESMTLEQRVNRVVGFLNSLGFMANVERSGEQLFVIRHNCIFNKTAKLYSGVLCSECDTALIKEPIGKKEIELVQCIGKGDTSCRNLIRA